MTMTASPGMDQAFPTQPPAAPATRRLLRSRTNRTFAGVCAGIAEYFGADPTAVRLLTIILGVLTGIFPMLVLYLIGAIVIPERIDGELPAGPTAPAIRVAPGQGGLILGILFVGIGIIALVGEVYRIDWDVLWPAALILLGGILVFAAQRR
jgi:phage shock protein C